MKNTLKSTETLIFEDFSNDFFWNIITVKEFRFYSQKRSINLNIGFRKKSWIFNLNLKHIFRINYLPKEANFHLAPGSDQWLNTAAILLN